MNIWTSWRNRTSDRRLGIANPNECFEEWILRRWITQKSHIQVGRLKEYIIWSIQLEYCVVDQEEYQSESRNIGWGVLAPCYMKRSGYIRCLGLTIRDTLFSGSSWPIASGATRSLMSSWAICDTWLAICFDRHEWRVTLRRRRKISDSLSMRKHAMNMDKLRNKLQWESARRLDYHSFETILNISCWTY